MDSNRRTPLRILFVAQVFYPSQAGGPANSVYWIAKHLDKEQFQPVIVTSDMGLDASVVRDQWMKTEAGEIIYVRTRVEKLSIKQTLVALRKLPSADVVQLSSLFYPPSLFTGIVARVLGKKILWSVRGEVDEPNYSTISPRRKKSAVRFLRVFLGRRVLYHSTCDVETANIRKAFGATAKIIQIPNFMELPPAVPAGTHDYLLFIGRIHSTKGLENLFQALLRSSQFLSSGMNLKLAGSGKPNYERSVHELARRLGIESRIEFHGHIVGAAKQKLLAGARFTIMPSNSENFGMVVLESLAQNTPVIASTGSPWSILEQEKVGLWVDNSPDSLASALDRMLAMSGTEYLSYRSRGRKFVEERFAIRDNIARWAAAYDSLVNEKSAGEAARDAAENPLF